MDLCMRRAAPSGVTVAQFLGVARRMGHAKEVDTNLAILEGNLTVSLAKQSTDTGLA